MNSILLLGAGRMGGAMIAGWRKVAALDLDAVMIRDPGAQGEALTAGAVNPPDAALKQAQVIVLAVKPQVWRTAAAEVAPLLAADAVVVSIAAGVKLADLSAGFGGRAVARVMPTTGVAIARGVATIFAHDHRARAAAHALFDPIADTVDIEDEDLMDAATAVSGSAPAYLYAFIEALEAAGAKAGLDADAARTLARGTITSAAALMEASGEDPAELRRQVTSPGGTTEAALKVLMGEGGFPSLLQGAVDAAIRRSKELGG